MVRDLKPLLASENLERLAEESSIEVEDRTTPRTFEMLVMMIRVELIIISSSLECEPSENSDFEKKIDCAEYACPPDVREFFDQVVRLKEMKIPESAEYLDPFGRDSFSVIFKYFLNVHN